jgi:autotransporter-associated beta strand protein
MSDSAEAQQRVLGADISYWNRGSSSGLSDGISQSAWNTAFSDSGGARKFVQIRASRGGTTGTNVSSGTPDNPSTPATLSQRYDDPDFFRNITRATNAGMIAGPYHFGRPDVAGNTGTDDANHFLEAASAWMRPGYMMPMFDLEAGSGLGGEALAQFSVDFSNRLYNVMKIRPSIYINGNYSSVLDGASASLRNQLAQPVGNGPTMVGPAYPVLWNARYSDNSSSAGNYAIPVQTGSPKTTYTTISSYYGAWDDYGNSSPWAMWQYGSVQSIPGFNTVDATVDGDVSHGDIEYVKDMMVPAVWWNDSSGDWGTMTNWNSGQPIGSFAGGDPFPTAPYTAAGQYPAVSGGVLPVPRLPGTAGSGPAITSGVNDTVILERPSANITVTLSSGTYNIRKFYMRETLNITGGSLTINYDPNYRADNSVEVLHSGPISAQFSGDVTLGGTGALTVHTVLVDAAKNFNFNAGTLTLNTMSLTSGFTPAKINVGGNVTISPLNNATAVIKATGSGLTPTIDLGGSNRTFTVGNGSAAVDVSFQVPVVGAGGLTKAGTGTLQLSAANSYAGPTTVNAGTLATGIANALPSATAMTVAAGATLDLASISQSVGSLSGAGSVTLGSAALTVGSANTSTSFSGAISGAGSLTKSGAGTLTLTGANSYTNGTTVSGGVLSGNTTGLQGNITNNAAVVFDQTTIGTYAGIMSGNGSLTKNNSGTVQLNGVNSFTGGTTINAGVLSLGASNRLANTGAVNIAGGTFDIGANSDTVGAVTLTSGSITGTTGVLTGSSYAVQSGTVSAKLAGSGALTKSGAGTVALTGVNTYTGGTNVHAGKLQVNRLHENNAVNITGGTLQVVDSSPTLPSHPAGNDAFVSRPGSMITIANNGAALGSRVYNGTLDLGNNDLIIDYPGGSPIANVEDMIRAGYHGGDWLGAGITSSAAASSAAGGNFVLAVADNASLSQPFGVSNGGPNFSGVNVPLNCVLVKFTHRVDLNLDGLVTDADAIIFSTNFEQGAAAHWAIGDLNYDGVFTDQDSMLFGTFYETGLQHLPEPGVATCLALAAVGLSRRRRTGRFIKVSTESVRL